MVSPYQGPEVGAAAMPFTGRRQPGRSCKRILAAPPATMSSRYGRSGTAIRKSAHMAEGTRSSCLCRMGLATWQKAARSSRRHLAACDVLLLRTNLRHQNVLPRLEFPFVRSKGNFDIAEGGHKAR